MTVTQRRILNKTIRRILVREIVEPLQELRPGVGVDQLVVQLRVVRVSVCFGPLDRTDDDRHDDHDHYGAGDESGPQRPPARVIPRCIRRWRRRIVDGARGRRRACVMEVGYVQLGQMGGGAAVAGEVVPRVGVGSVCHIGVCVDARDEGDRQFICRVIWIFGCSCPKTRRGMCRGPGESRRRTDGWR